MQLPDDHLISKRYTKVSKTASQKYFQMHGDRQRYSHSVPKTNEEHTKKNGDLQDQFLSLNFPFIQQVFQIYSEIFRKPSIRPKINGWSFPLALYFLIVKQEKYRVSDGAVIPKKYYFKVMKNCLPRSFPSTDENVPSQDQAKTQVGCQIPCQ